MQVMMEDILGQTPYARHPEDIPELLLVEGLGMTAQRFELAQMALEQLEVPVTCLILLRAAWGCFLSY